MQSEKINICLCSESEDINPIKSILNGVKGQSFNLTVSKPEEAAVEQHEIIVYYLDKLSNAILRSMEKVKITSQVKSIVVLEGNDIQLLSTLAKMGLKDIFVFPYELFKFHSFLDELLQSVKPESSDDAVLSTLSNPVSSFIGNFPEMDNILSLARKAAENPSLNVLLLGDTGTGKSVLARLIHSIGEKKRSPFIEVICTAIPENLLESELFGYEKGAFTDAKSRKIGLFELAEGGTIFLDEIGDLSLNLQAKLLYVTEKKVIRRLGGIKDIPIKTRIITATNRNLENQIEKNLFRRDLFYRLNMISMTLPPLTERGDDILLLTENFVKEFSQLYGKSIKCITNQAWDIIRSYKWPGNVRELRNIIERAVLLSEEPVLEEKYFTSIKNPVQPNDLLYSENIRLMDQGQSCLPASSENKSAENNNETIVLKLKYNELTLAEVNKLYAKEILAKLSGNKTKTSKMLGISRPTLDNLLN